jgi:hypothetical protein
MIPTALVAGFLLGLVLRWPSPSSRSPGAVYMVADAHLLGGAMLGAANAAVGTAVAVVARRVASPSADRAPGI